MNWTEFNQNNSFIRSDQELGFFLWLFFFFLRLTPKSSDPLPHVSPTLPSGLRTIATSQNLPSFLLAGQRKEKFTSESLCTAVLGFLLKKKKKELLCNHLWLTRPFFIYLLGGEREPNDFLWLFIDMAHYCTKCIFEEFKGTVLCRSCFFFLNSWQVWAKI